MAHGSGPDTDDDPLAYVQLLRMHIFSSSLFSLHLLERVKLLDHLNEYCEHYNDVLTLASTTAPLASTTQDTNTLPPTPLLSSCVGYTGCDLA